MTGALDPWISSRLNLMSPSRTMFITSLGGSANTGAPARTETRRDGCCLICPSFQKISGAGWVDVSTIETACSSPTRDQVDDAALAETARAPPCGGVLFARITRARALRRAAPRVARGSRSAPPGGHETCRVHSASCERIARTTYKRCSSGSASAASRPDRRVGLYTLVSMVLNVDRHPAPENLLK